MGEDYVSILQRRFIGMMSDAEMGVMEEFSRWTRRRQRKSCTIGRSTTIILGRW